MTRSPELSAVHQQKSLVTSPTRCTATLLAVVFSSPSILKFWKTPTVTVCPTNSPKTIQLRANLLKIWTMTVTVLLTFQKPELESTMELQTWEQTRLILIRMMTVSVTVQTMFCRNVSVVLTQIRLEPVHSDLRSWSTIR